MKTFLLTCLAVMAMASVMSLIGCSDDREHQDTSYQSATMTTDSKDMHPVHH